MTKKNKYILLSLLVALTTIVVLSKTYSSTGGDTYQFACGVPPARINTASLDTSGRDKLVFDPPFRWKKHNLKVFFTDINDTNLIDKTINIANEWSNSANIKFILTIDKLDSDIRVSFRENRGCLSVIGSIAEDEAYLGEATLWLQDLDMRTDNEFRRVVLHEFGHAIGLLHELQSPESNIQWDSSAVYDYYYTTYKWPPQMVNDNIFIKFNTGEYTRFDPNSIVIYAVPAFLTKDHAEIAWPEGLSSLDKKTIIKYYPFRSKKHE